MSLLEALSHGGWLRAVDAGLADSLRRARADTADAVLAAAALTSRALANGHSRLPLARVRELLLEIAGDRVPPSLPALPDWLAQLQASPWLAPHPGAVLVLEDDTLALRRYWQYEVRLAVAIAARLPASCAAPVDLATRLRQLFGAPGPEGDHSQALAARAALQHRLLLLTGGPGTGKTSTVARTLVLFAEQFAAHHAGVPARILLAAPTGKAAARLAESVRDNLAGLAARGLIDAATPALPREASTLHRLLGWQRGRAGFRHDATHPLPADLVIVDEASMIDLPMMCKLVEAVAAQATLVLIGDRDQLPSVETGDVLAALCDAAERPGSRLAAHRVNLTHTHRQATGVDVGALATLVREGQAAAVLEGLASARFRGVHWCSGGDRALGEAVLAVALPAYRELQSAIDVPSALRLAQRFRVLTAVREGAAGSQTLNAQIANALDAAPRGDGQFHGRLVLINQNSYRHQLFNGDIGIAWLEPSGELRVWFDADGGPRAWLPAALPAHESAFALTVHKAQGSEFDRVLLALPEHGARVLSRELLYTGLTRCRSEVTLWAEPTVLGEAIQRQAQRWSGLADRL